MDKKCISLKALYEENGAELHFGGYIDFYRDGESGYYDLKTKPPDMPGSDISCCDGEGCEIIRDDGKTVLLSNIETKNKFYLTKKEYDIATFG